MRGKRTDTFKLVRRVVFSVYIVGIHDCDYD